MTAPSSAPPPPPFAPGHLLRAEGGLLLPGVPAADPHLCAFGGRYYLYGTGMGKTEPGFAAWSSADLSEWRFEGMVLRLRDVAWARKDDWAPAVAHRNGRFFLYFCADSQIGVAVSDSPAGPFADALGAPLVPFREDLSSIDPMPFVDEDGQAFLCWGAVWKGEPLRIQRLAPDMVTLTGEPVELLRVPRSGEKWHVLEHVEAPLVFRRDAEGGRPLYHLMWSPGHFWMHRYDGEDIAYRVHAATAPTPLGPFTPSPDNPVLCGRPELGIFSPGHHSVLEAPGTGEWLICYHANDGRLPQGHPGGDDSRRVRLDRMTFAPDGRIAAIEPTQGGPGARPPGLGLRLRGAGPFRDGRPVPFEVTADDDAVLDAPPALFCGRAATPLSGVRFSGTRDRNGGGHVRVTGEMTPAGPGFCRLRAVAAGIDGVRRVSPPVDLDVTY